MIHDRFALKDLSNSIGMTHDVSYVLLSDKDGLSWMPESYPGKELGFMFAEAYTWLEFLAEAEVECKLS